MKNKDEEENKEANENLEKLFKETLGNENLKIKVESLKAENVSAIMQLSEQTRRMQEMSKMYGMDMGFGAPDETLVLNSNNAVVKLLMDIKDDSEKTDDTKMICKQIYDLAMLSHKPLAMEEMAAFIERSNKILSMVASK